MATAGFDIAGALVYWSFTKASNLSMLQECLERHGFLKHCPERMTNGAALKAALSEEFPGHKIFPVLSEKDVDKFEVVSITGDDNERNAYRHVLTASKGVDRIQTDLYDADLEARLYSHFCAFVSMVPQSQLTKTMVAIIGELGGVTMKPSGGVYWLPANVWDRWVALVEDVTLCGTGNRFDACRVVLDTNCVKAITQALTAEVDREAARINEAFNDENTGSRAISTLKRQSQSLQEKITEYEKAFSIALPNLKKSLDDAMLVEAQATLFESSQPIELVS